MRSSMPAFGREAERDASLLALETAQNGASEICVHLDRPESLDGGGCPSGISVAFRRQCADLTLKAAELKGSHHRVYYFGNHFEEK